MSFADPHGLSDEIPAEPQKNLALRLWEWIVITWRPARGWTILLCTLLLSILPMQAASVNEWIVLGEYGSTVIPMGPLGVLLIWTIMGWRHERGGPNPALGLVTSGGGVSRLRVIVLSLLVVGVGLFALSQALVGWIPGPFSLVQSISNSTVVELLTNSWLELLTIPRRLVRWWAGVLAGGATQDDLVFATFAGLTAWVNGVLTGYLVRRRYSGLFCGFPSLWLLMLTLLYGSVGRMIFVMGLLVTLLLHVIMDHQQLDEEWKKDDISYGDGLIFDRLLTVLVASVIIFGAASLTPNLRLSSLAERYLRLYQPFNDQVEGFGQRLFPDMKVTSRFRGAALSDGLPNSFLLGAGPELSETEVMRYRTDEPVIFEPDILEEVPAPGHYVRGGSLSIYDGHGWENPLGIERVNLEADQFVPNLNLNEPLSFVDGEPNIPRGRRLLTQDIFLRFNSRGLYGAAEPISFSTDYRLDRRHPGDQTSFAVDRTAGGSPGVSSYTVISAIPNVRESALAEEENVVLDDEDPLWDVLSHHLALPDTITDRTRDLASELTDGLNGPYAKATAIESYLRGYEYDLSVTTPPPDVQDVADYFLFDLQRGYCDYYATAFIVLARLAGLPARFSTGFVPGSWSSADEMWVITEAEAHSWPEVYFPSYGWIPFEPTAGRSALFRSGVGLENITPSSAPILPVPTGEAEMETSASWNWQVLLWLLPLGLLIWGAYQLFNWWQHKQQDPWLTILRWGQRIGRPIRGGETVIEYGHELGGFVLERYRHRHQDIGRTVAREISDISVQLSTVQYGTAEQRSSARKFIEEKWRLLRSYIARL